MKINILISLFILLFAISGLKAQTDNYQKIYESASLFYQSRNTTADVPHLRPHPITKSQGSTPLCYIFQREDQPGFIIISAHPAAWPVLAYSYESNFDVENNPAAADWLKSMEEQIQTLYEQRIPANSNTSRAWQNFYSKGEIEDIPVKNVAPLLTTTWNQDCYYNELCPIAASGPCGRCYAGCVATAMGQVMKYHNYPPMGQGDNMYGTGSYSNIHADFDTTYYWDQMPNAISSSNSAIATLLFHLGVAVCMQYDPTGSGASTDYARNAMVDYFLYADYATMVDKMEDEMWNQLMRTECEANRPVLYRGYGDGGGHAFVLDGFQGASSFHINWGWGGSANGYFYLNNLLGFDDGQAAMIGVEPSVGDVQHCNANTTMTALTDTIRDGSDTLKYGNDSNCKWLIQPPGAGLINIDFTWLRTEKDIDFIYIYQGSTTSDPLVVSISGYTAPSTIQIWGSSALLWFVSDGLFRDQGFEAVYTTSMAGIEEALNQEKIIIYPVPATDVINISIDPLLRGMIQEISLFNNTGQMIYTTRDCDINNIEIPVSEYAAGSYFIRLYDGNNSVMRPVVIE